MDPNEPEHRAVPEDSTPGARPTRLPRWDRAGLWRAIAGMALAVAIGAAMASVEFAIELSHRTSYFERHLASLSATVRTLRRRESAHRSTIVIEKERASTGQLAERLLFTPGLRIVKLIAPGPKPSAKSAAGARNPAALLAVSGAARIALLAATGFRPAGPHRVYRVWWAPKPGAAVWAADFTAAADGRAAVELELPAGWQNFSAIEITTGTGNRSDVPAGQVLLRGEWKR
ncbi:MAG: hypothetical protein ACREQI_02330 [Candidatus Binataceae bacterium]